MAAGRVVFYSVVQQIADDLHEPRLVSDHRRRFWQRDINLNLSRLRYDAGVDAAGRDNLGEVER